MSLTAYSSSKMGGEGPTPEGPAIWGAITGNILNQTDLIAYISANSGTTPSYKRIYFGAASTSNGHTTSIADFRNKINSAGFTVEAGKLLKLTVGGLRKVDGIQQIITQDFEFYPNNVLGTWGTGSTNGAITTQQLYVGKTNILSTSEGTVSYVDLGDLGTEAIEDYLGDLPNDTHELLDNGTEYFFTCTINGVYQTYRYEGSLPVSFGNTTPVTADFDLISDSGVTPTESGGHTFGGEITTNTTLNSSHKGKKWFRLIGDIVITVPEDLLEITDNPIFIKKTGNPEFVSGTGFRLRGVRDIDNRYFFNDNYSGIALTDCSNDEAVILGNLKRGYTGAVLTTSYGNLESSETANVPVTGTGFSANMVVTLTGNATLNSWTYVNNNNITLNITSSGTDGDYLTVTYDNGDVYVDTNAIQLNDLAVPSIIMTTTSTNATWSPSLVTNTGDTLRWTVTGGATGIYDANDPTIDLSGNSGTAIITVTSNDNLAGLTSMYLTTLGIITGNFDSAINLVSLRLTTNYGLTSLSVDGCVALEELRVFWGGLTSIDLSNNIALDYLQIANNTSLGGIDLSNNTALEYVDLTNCGLTSLDLSVNTSINQLLLSSNSSLSAVVGLSLLTSLTTLSISNCSFSSIDISTLTALVNLYIANNSNTNLDISTNTLLKAITINGNSFSASVINNIILDRYNNGVLTGTRTMNYTGATPTATEDTTNDVLDAYNALVSAGWTILGTTPS